MHRRTLKRASRRCFWRKERMVEIWFWALGIVAAFSVVAVVIDRRRGSTGASKAHDEPGAAPARHWLNYRGDIMND